MDQTEIIALLQEDFSNENITKAIMLDLHHEYLESQIQPKSANEKNTFLGQERNSFDYTRPKILQAADEFPELLQIMIDLDATLFPLDRAMRARGVDIQTQDMTNWDDDGDSVGDAVMTALGRSDLLHDKIQGPRQKEEKVLLLVDFFAEIHSDTELMRHAGVFEYAPQMIKIMRAHKIDIHILTHRSVIAASATETWLEAMDIEYDYLVCELPDKLDKIQYCHQEQIPLIFDDKPATIAEAEQSGIQAVSLAWPYTKSALEKHGGDQALCWREMTHIGLDIIENLIHKKRSSS